METEVITEPVVEPKPKLACRCGYCLEWFPFNVNGQCENCKNLEQRQNKFKLVNRLTVNPDQPPIWSGYE